MTPEQFARGMLVLTETFRVDDATPVLRDAYWHALNDLSAADWNTAVREAVRTRVHFPRPAELRACAPKPALWRCPHTPPCGSQNWCRVLELRAAGVPEFQVGNGPLGLPDDTTRGGCPHTPPCDDHRACRMLTLRATEVSA